MSILSNVDLEKEIGENILIYPFFLKNIRGATYNLTASKLAWDIKTKKSIYDQNVNKLIIPSKSTVLIETNESIWVSNKISGTYHSKVKLVSQGLSHVSTTLDPLYIGSSLIAIHNNNEQEITLIPEQDTFITLKFHYLATESSISPGNSAGRTDILLDYSLSQEEKNWLDQDFMNAENALKTKLQECPDYQIVVEKRHKIIEQFDKKERNKAKIIKKRRTTWIIIGSSSLITLIFVFLLIFLSSNESSLKSKGWYSPLMNLSYTLLILVPGSTLVAGLTKVYSDW
ncbi:hypothetical protein STA3757_24340 [Stanieria sp. NIES-3757]|nr:hypothetical protein STA3757_24340 [Stanieria sp. NIES-3757]